MGEYDGDKTCGVCCFGTCCCDNSAWDLFDTEVGRTSQWFKARAYEDSSCPYGGNIQHRVTLSVPAGTNYDLYVYRTCGSSPIASSTNGTGEDETVTFEEPESAGDDDSFDYYVWVRWRSGSSCSNWTLRFYGHDC